MHLEDRRVALSPEVNSDGEYKFRGFLISLSKHEANKTYNLESEV